MMKTLLVATAVCGAITLHARVAQAQSQGRVIVDTAVIWRIDTSIVAASAKKDTVLDLTARSDRWYQVVIPRELSAGGVTVGLIARSQVQLLPGSPEPPLRPLRGNTTPRGSAAPSAQPAPPRGKGPPLPGFVDVNATYQTMSGDSLQHGSFTVYAEQATFDTTYAVDTAPSFNIGAGGLVTSHFAVAGVVSRLSRSTSPDLTGSVPHPFFFNDPRTVAGTVGPLHREELAFHGQARAVIPIGRRFRAMAFGGPSWFRVTQDIVTAFSFNQAYPFDQATLQAATTSSTTKSRLGFNAGGDATFFVSRQVGVGFTVMYSRADLTFPAGDSTTGIVAGGLQTGGGLRIRF